MHDVSWSWVLYIVRCGLEIILNHWYPMTLTHDLLTQIPIAHILYSWGANVWSFMTMDNLHSPWVNYIVSYGPKPFSITSVTWHWLLSKNINSTSKINSAHPWLIGVNMYDASWSQVNYIVIVRKPFSVINLHGPDLWPFNPKQKCTSLTHGPHVYEDSRSY